MKKVMIKIPVFMIAIITLVICLNTAFKGKEKSKIGFLVHDLVSERWKQDASYFFDEVNSLGGEAIVKNAFGDARAQINQGKELIDGGVKVLVVVAQDGNMLAELVDYAEKKHVKVIAYDRMINNCNLAYYISYNSVKVGELMAEHALKTKPKGNYVLLYGPSSDNNAQLIKQGIHNKLSKSIQSGEVKLILEKQLDTWYGLDSYMVMEDFLTSSEREIDAVIASNDDIAGGVIDALKLFRKNKPFISGQDASVEACRNIISGHQSMSVYKSIKQLAKEAAQLSIKIAGNEQIMVNHSTFNGKHDVPSILFDPVAIDKSTIKSLLLAEGHIKEGDI